MRKTGLITAGFEDGRKGPRAKECGQPLEAGKDKDSPLPPLEVLLTCFRFLTSSAVK